MKTMKKTREGRPSQERRRLLGLLTGSAAAGLAWTVSPLHRGPEELDLREADFYKRHDLAG